MRCISWHRCRHLLINLYIHPLVQNPPVVFHDHAVKPGVCKGRRLRCLPTVRSGKCRLPLRTLNCSDLFIRAEHNVALLSDALWAFPV